MIVKCPGIKYPLVDLDTNPDYPKGYLELEASFIKEEQELLNVEPLGTIWKEVLRYDVLQKREEFNRLWNKRSLEIRMNA